MEQAKFNEIVLKIRRSDVDVNESIKLVIGNAYLSLVERGLIKGEETLCDSIINLNSNIDNEIVKNISLELKALERKDVIDFVSQYLEYVANDPSNFTSSIPESIFEFVYRLLDIKNGDKVLDAGSGIGSFLGKVAMRAMENNNNDLKLEGIEINIEWANISKMLLTIVSDYQTDIQIGNIINEDFEKFDKGFVFPPFGMRQLIGNELISSKLSPSLSLSNRNTSEWIFIDRLLSKMNDEGKAVALVTAGALFNVANFKYRNELLDKGLIEAIVELPQGLFPYVGVKTCIVVFSKGNDSVKVIDGTKYFVKQGRGLNHLSYDQLFEDYKLDLFGSRDNAALKELGNLVPSTVLLDVKKPENGVMIKEVAKVFNGSQYTSKNFESMFTDKDTGYRILTSIDINDGMVDWNNLKKIDCPKQIYDKYILQEGDVVVTSKSSTVKTVVVNGIKHSEKIIVTGGMLVIRPIKEKINSTYIKIFLDSEEGKKALKSIQKGAVITTINAKSLEELYIPMIDIDDQNKRANKYNDLLTTMNALNLEIKKIQDKIANFKAGEE